MTPDPDVTPVGFAATEGPGAVVRRRRNPVWLALAVLCLVAGISGIAGFVTGQLANAPGRDEAVATGKVARLGAAETTVARYSGSGDYTLWIQLDGVRNDLDRDRIVAATNCEVRFGNGSSARFRGARQGSSVVIGSRATVGTFTAPDGAVAIGCRQLPFGSFRGRDALEHERGFFVTEGAPGVGWPSWVGMFVGIALLVLAFPLFGRWRAGEVR